MTQLEDGRALAERQGIEVVAEFEDKNVSAYHGNRGPDLARALAECERLATLHGTCALIVQHSDRLARGDGREAKHLLSYALWALEHNISIRSVQDPRTFEDLIYTTIEGHRNHEDSKRKAAAVSDGLRRSAERGKSSGGPRPYGYRWHAWLDDDGKRDSELRQVPAEVTIVRRIYADTINGASQKGIALALNRDGIPSATGKRWLQASVRNILCSPVYLGKVRLNGRTYDGAHEAIIDELTWDAAAAMRRTAAATKQHGGGRQPRGHHLLTKGLLRCSCGATMGVRTSPNRQAPPTESYHCDGRYNDLTSCSQKSIPRAVIDEAILEEVTSVYLDLDATRERLRARRSADRELAEGVLAEREAESLRVGERLQRLQRYLQDGHMDPEDYRDQRVGLIEEQSAAQAAVEQARQRATEVSPQVDDVEEETLRRLAEIRATVLGGIDNAPDLDALRTLLRQLFKAVRLVHVGGKLRLHPEPRAEVFALHDYYQAHGTLPDPFGPDWPDEPTKRLPLPLSVVSDENGLASTSSPPRSSTRIR